MDYRLRQHLRQIATDTLGVLNAGTYTLKGVDYHLRIKDLRRKTTYYPPHDLTHWSSHRTVLSPPSHATTSIHIVEISTLDCARLILKILRNNSQSDAKIGVLNFASATKPGGGFKNGAQAQEESIARSSTLFASLETDTAQSFYDVHKAEARNPFYTHSIIYSPGVEVFRTDDGGWTKPFPIDVLTCAAVNAEEVHRSFRARQLGRTVTEREIHSQMKERMARILFIFEEKGVRNLVLGSFGTGVFKNDVGVIAQIWAELLSGPEARFGRSFDRVFFAIIGRKTFVDFGNAYNQNGNGGQDPDRPRGIFGGIVEGVKSFF